MLWTVSRKTYVCTQSRDITFPTKVHLVKATVFPVVMCGCAPKNWCFWIVVSGKTLESPLDCKEIKPVNPKGNQFWIYIGRTDAEAEAAILWPPDVKSWLIGKRSWRWARLKAGGEGDDRGWDGWMASSIWWTRVWASSGSWWWTGKPRVLQSMGSQRIEHGWATELNWRCTLFWIFYWRLFFFIWAH